MGKGLINGHNMLLTTINSVMARGVRFLLGFRVPVLEKNWTGYTRFWSLSFFFLPELTEISGICKEIVHNSQKGRVSV